MIDVLFHQQGAVHKSEQADFKKNTRGNLHLGNYGMAFTHGMAKREDCDVIKSDLLFAFPGIDTAVLGGADPPSWYTFAK